MSRPKSTDQHFYTLCNAFQINTILYIKGLESVEQSGVRDGRSEWCCNFDAWNTFWRIQDLGYWQGGEQVIIISMMILIGHDHQSWWFSGMDWRSIRTSSWLIWEGFSLNLNTLVNGKPPSDLRLQFFQHCLWINCEQNQSLDQTSCNRFTKTKKYIWRFTSVLKWTLPDDKWKQDFHKSWILCNSLMRDCDAQLGEIE